MGHEIWREADQLGDEVTAHLATVRHALRDHERGAPAALDRAFGAAAAAIALVRGEHASEPADTTEAKALLGRLPALERLVDVAVAEAERSAQEEARALWEWLGLASAPPRWDQPERDGARALVTCACAPLEQRGPGWLRIRLLALVAQRWATVLSDELRDADESVWVHALGNRYDSVRHRYAPRTRWRSRTLANLLEQDDTAVAALRRRLRGWFAAGGDLGSLRDELEAAFVERRTPPARA